MHMQRIFWGAVALAFLAIGAIGYELDIFSKHIENTAISLVHSQPGPSSPPPIGPSPKAEIATTIAGSRLPRICEHRRSEC